MSTKKIKAEVLSQLNDFLGEMYRDIKSDIFSHIPEYKSKLKKELLLAKKKIFNQTVCVIGPPASGKTSLLKVLKNPQIERSEIEGYQKTESVAFESFPVKWNVAVDDETQINFGFNVAAGIDNGGEDYIREGHWAKAIKDGAVVWYIFDFKAFEDPHQTEAYTARILKDFEWIGENVNMLKSDFSVMIIGNKVDAFCRTMKELSDVELRAKARLSKLHRDIVENMPKGYKRNIKEPALISLYDKRIRNAQFSNLMLSLMGTSLVDIINECSKFEKRKRQAEK